MFKFSFQPEELNEEFAIGDESVESIPLPPAAAAIPCVACEEIHPTADQLSASADSLKHGLILFAGGQEIIHLKSDVLIDDLIEDQIQARLRDERERREAAEAAVESHATDLIPGVYEGGGKIWECTQDLGDFLSQEDEPNGGRSLLHTTAGRQVLDLGCGAGLLGVLALQQGAHVHFQDYNREIITKVTIPNAVLNSAADNAEHRKQQLARCRFFAGDWSHYLRRYNTEAPSAPQFFDMILTCETIYNPDNNQKIIDVLRSMLRPVTGVAYLAAKTYYFGVGGGVRAFEALLAKDGALRSEVVWKSAENVQREILKITHRRD